MAVNTTLMIMMAITAITTPAIVPIDKNLKKIYALINIEMYFACMVSCIQMT